MKNTVNMAGILVLVAAFGLLGGSRAEAVSLEADRVDAFLVKHCFECHDELSGEAGLDLEAVGFDLKHREDFEVWAQVFERVESGEMPPKKKERPGEAEKAAFLKQLGRPLMKADLEDKAAKGRVNVRRLTRREYEHTVHDLLGVDLPLQELLPEDAATHGFETVAAGQQFSHFNLAAYLEAADLALDEAFGRAIEGDSSFSVELGAAKLGRGSYRGGNYRGPETRGGVSIAWPIRQQFYGRMPATRVPESGWYRVTLKDVHAINAKGGAVWGTLRSGAGNSAEPMLYPIGVVEATAERRDLSFEARIRKGHLLELKPNDATLKRAPTGASGGNVSYKGRNLEAQGFSGIGVTGIEIERIYPNAERWELRAALLGGLKKEEAFKMLSPMDDPEPLLRRAIRSFAGRAFRRPVDDAVVAPYVELAVGELEGSEERPVEGLRAAYRAILCSPRFLTLIEKPGALDAHAVASRLSYMLWNSMPDGALRKLADDGSLLKPEVRRAQVERLLGDAKAERFVESFADQWLNLKDIDFTSPDLRLYRTFDEVVKASMLEETRAFVKDLFGRDGSITNVIDADFAMLNERLARFYGMKGVDVKPGGGLQRVALEGEVRRGGIVTQGAVLKVTANGTTTSPVVRGVYVAERLLGLHIPPPPADVPAVEPDVRGAVSIRDQLAKHMSSASCAACHVKIDPGGFALENFDPVGLWRERYGKRPNSAKVDPSGVTPEGEKFGGIWGWKQIYVKQPKLLAKAFAKQLLTYATGAEPRFSDRGAIEKIVEDAGGSGYGMRSLLHGVVASEAFLTK